MSAWDHVEVTCYRDDCGATIALHRGHYETLRNTTGSFYCPNGHGQHFVGKTDEEKRIEELEREVRATREARDRWVEHWEETQGALDSLVHIAGVCPMGCGWRTDRRLRRAAQDEDGIARFTDRVWGDLREHLLTDHNATLKPVALLPQEAGA